MPPPPPPPWRTSRGDAATTPARVAAARLHLQTPPPLSPDNFLRVVGPARSRPRVGRSTGYVRRRGWRRGATRARTTCPPPRRSERVRLSRHPPPSPETVFIARAARPRPSARSAAVGARTPSLSRRGDPGGPPAIRSSPRLMAAPTGTPTASPEVAGSLPRVGSIGGRELRATGGPRWQEGWHHCGIFGRCCCVLPWFCYKQACTIAHPKFNVGVVVEKFEPESFCHL